ncbi:hypothetical protein [Actinomadura montaniterrae]|uniref:Uncharacterized protein n=1 Tax=Actinomadura montaniterrae TaxID=1803903 RepID=A0A6L3VQD9_9ACTN|nr:hypothetical protein [Actinomadura montaniterrae]KAB2379022.1 hypothetical protein F9B16_22490 [Actinomadura montaniterrae]
MALRRRGRLALGAAGAVLLIASAITVRLVLTWDPRGPDVKDPRACPGSNVSLSEVTGHFGLVIPPDATDVRFSSDLHPFFGEYSLRLSFRTTASGLRLFLDRSGLSTSSTEDDADTDPAPLDGPSCGFGSASFHDPRYYAGERPAEGGPTQRQAAVDRSDAAQPRVVVSAMDL